MHTKITIREVGFCKEHLEFYTSRPDLLGCVRTLVVKSFPVKKISSVLEGIRFPKLTKVSLEGLRAPDEVLIIIDYLEKEMPNLRSLSIEDTNFPKDRLLSFILLWPSLTSLSIHNSFELPAAKNENQDAIGRLDKSIQNITGNGNAMSLQDLQVDFSSGSLTFIRHIQQLESRPSIEYTAVYLAVCNRRDWGSTEWFLRAISAMTVKSLHINESRPSQYSRFHSNVYCTIFSDSISLKTGYVTILMTTTFVPSTSY